MVSDNVANPGASPVEAPAGMVLVPGVEVELGSALDADENPMRTVRIPSFFVDVHPATNADYVEFVADTGHRVPKHWVNNHPVEGEENHPVVWLSWFDATAYAKWAGKRLPTDDEWEVAARGADGREFPWGYEFLPDRCNCRASGLGGLCSVSSFPQGVSPFGCHNMAGNVWEWTDSWHEESHEHRVLCGGSWASGIMSVRTCYRGRDLPTYWSNVYGVRCVRSVDAPPQPGDRP